MACTFFYFTFWSSWLNAPFQWKSLSVRDGAPCFYVLGNGQIFLQSNPHRCIAPDSWEVDESSIFSLCGAARVGCAIHLVHYCPPLNRRSSAGGPLSPYDHMGPGPHVFSSICLCRFSMCIWKDSPSTPLKYMTWPVKLWQRAFPSKAQLTWCSSIQRACFGIWHNHQWSDIMLSDVFWTLAGRLLL